MISIVAFAGLFESFPTLAAAHTVLADGRVYLAEHLEVVRGYTALHRCPRAHSAPEVITPP
jgi:hypothetical protein